MTLSLDLVGDAAFCKITKLSMAHNVAVVTKIEGRESMRTVSSEQSEDERPIPDRLLDAALSLLANEGPSAIKARAVGAASGMSSMVVYNYFGGVPELVRAMADRGFEDLGKAFAALPITDDPVGDLFVLAATCRDIARANPHLYDLMFGLSSRATYRPTTDAQPRLAGHSPAFQAAYAVVLQACERLVASGRIRSSDPEVVCAQLWSFVHGFISLELTEHFNDFEDPALEVLVPMGVVFSVGLGDDLARAQASHEAAVARLLSLRPATA